MERIFRWLLSCVPAGVATGANSLWIHTPSTHTCMYPWRKRSIVLHVQMMIFVGDWRDDWYSCTEVTPLQVSKEWETAILGQISRRSSIWEIPSPGNISDWCDLWDYRIGKWKILSGLSACPHCEGCSWLKVLSLRMCQKNGRHVTDVRTWSQTREESIGQKSGKEGLWHSSCLWDPVMKVTSTLFLWH